MVSEYLVLDPWKLAVSVTALLGIAKVQGFAEAPPLHEAPEIVQPAKLYPDDATAVTETATPAE